jgi:hypothetical protein
MNDVEALIRIRVQRPRWGQVPDTDAIKPGPVQLPLVAPLSERSSPEATQSDSEQRKALQVPRNGMVVVGANIATLIELVVSRPT